MPTMTLTQRRWLLILHLLFVAIWFGTNVVFLILSLAASFTKDESMLQSAFTIMHLLSETSGRASIIGSVVTGILLSVLTKWGLFKYKWIIAKEIMTLISLGVGMVGIYFWTLHAFSITADDGMAAVHNGTFIANRNWLYCGIVFQILSLGTMYGISVFKPWGKRKGA